MDSTRVEKFLFRNHTKSSFHEFSYCN